MEVFLTIPSFLCVARCRADVSIKLGYLHPALYPNQMICGNEGSSQQSRIFKDEGYVTT
jgi:hypothetical protein